MFMLLPIVLVFSPSSAARVRSIREKDGVGLLLEVHVDDAVGSSQGA